MVKNYSRRQGNSLKVNLHEFLESFQLLLDWVTRDNKVCYIMGDFNLDLLNTDSHSVTNEFINTLFSHTLYPLISKPTGTTSHSTTLIDKIFTNNISTLSDNGLIIMIFPTIYQSSRSLTPKFTLLQTSLGKVSAFATSLVRILIPLTTFCVSLTGILWSMLMLMPPIMVSCKNILSFTTKAYH